MSIGSILPGDAAESVRRLARTHKVQQLPSVHRLGTRRMTPGHPIAGSLTCADAPPAAATTLSNAE
jgi:hypothetical protein